MELSPRIHPGCRVTTTLSGIVSLKTESFNTRFFRWNPLEEYGSILHRIVADAKWLSNSAGSEPTPSSLCGRIGLIVNTRRYGEAWGNNLKRLGGVFLFYSRSDYTGGEYDGTGEGQHSAPCREHRVNDIENTYTGNYQSAD